MQVTSGLKSLSNGCRTSWARFWLDYALLCVLVAGLFSAGASQTGTRQLLTADTLLEHAYPHHEDTVPDWTVLVLPWAVPIAVFLVAAAFKWTTSIELHSLCLNALYAVAVTGLITSIAKLQIGRPRPSFVTRCLPNLQLNEVSLNATEVMQQLQPRLSMSACSPAFSVECTDNHQNSFESFPSGHTSMYTAGGLFLTLFLIHKLRVYRGCSHPAALVLAMIPTVAASWVGLTRVTDYAHFPTDVRGGFVIGAAVGALFFYCSLKDRQECQHGGLPQSRLASCNRVDAGSVSMPVDQSHVHSETGLP